MLGEDLIGLRREAAAGAGGNVIHDDGGVDPVGDVLIVHDKTGLGGLVIIGGHQQKAVRAGLLRVVGEVKGSGGVVAAGAGNDLDAVVHVLHAVVHAGNVLPDGLGGGLAGGSTDADGVRSGSDLHIQKLTKLIEINALLVKGGDDGDTGAGENRLLQ